LRYLSGGLVQYLLVQSGGADADVSGESTIELLRNLIVLNVLTGWPDDIDKTVDSLPKDIPYRVVEKL